MKNIKLYEDFSSDKLEEGKLNTTAVKDLIKDLESTPHSVGIALLRERMLAHAKADLKRIEADPKPWENPLFTVEMYKDLFKRMIKHLEFN